MTEYKSDGKTQYWNLDLLIKNIQEKRRKYFYKYGMFPRYVKLPYGLPSVLAGEYMAYEHDKICYCCGLIICETLSIQTPDEVEVF